MNSWDLYNDSFQVDDHNLVIEHCSIFPGGRYCRSSDLAREQFGAEMKELYGLESSADIGRYAVLTSGMNAIAALVQIVHQRSQVLKEHHKTNPIAVLGDELYCDTMRTFKYNTQWEIKSVDVRKPLDILDFFKQQGRDIYIFFLESCTNPSGQMFDFKLITELRNLAPFCVFVVDNTWCTALGFNPFHYDVDIVVESTTKYISNGKCIGGVLIGNHSYAAYDLFEKIDEWIRVFGQHVGKYHSHMFRMGLKTIKERMTSISDLAPRVAKHLENLDCVSRVMYPTLQSHPTHELAKEFLKLNPGCIWFHLLHDLPSNSAVRKRLQKIGGENQIILETSYGSKHSKLDPWPKTKHSNAYDIDSTEEGEKGVWLRLAIGCNDSFEEIIPKLENTLNYIATISTKDISKI